MVLVFGLVLIVHGVFSKTCGLKTAEPGSGINRGLLAFVGGDALGAKYADEF
jgi:hypothetical protein